MSGLDPKVLRKRIYGTKADKWGASIAPDVKYTRRCRMCRCQFWPGEAMVKLLNAVAHRQCLKEWLEATFDVLPPQPDEQERHLAGPLSAVDTERLQREFQEYRQGLVERMTAAPEIYIPAGQTSE